MLNEFRQFISGENLFRPEHKILLAVSGGADSSVMAELFFRSGYSFGLAHCNFGLRKEESERDESFVRQMARNYQVELHVRKFETREFARRNKLSVQMAARQLRYDWFGELMSRHGYARVSTAHHRDDQVETFLINLARGTGISGLRGILPLQGLVIRPLLFASAARIREFAAVENIGFVEDSSNKSLKYARNRIRHRVVPQMARINEAFPREIIRTIEQLRDVESIYRRAVEDAENKLLIHQEGRTIIPIDRLRKLSPLRTWLFEFIRGYGFKSTDLSPIIGALDEIPGKIFYSSTHCLLKDRENLVIEKRSDQVPSEEEYYIDRADTEVNHPFRMRMEWMPSSFPSIDKDPTLALLDADMLEFPLLIRRWKTGDSFRPIGMTGRKKISDFLTDQKVPRTAKKNVWVLCSSGEIAWVIGMRLSDRFKITIQTRTILQITPLSNI
jgi:tRNA(Ile)-lysidine synthase